MENINQLIIKKHHIYFKDDSKPLYKSRYPPNIPPSYSTFITSTTTYPGV